MNRKIPILILGIALFCRLSLALGRTDMIWPDEQFQTLEPASQVIFGHSYLAWEWLRGFRSWLLPAFFMPILFLAKILGFKSGLPLILFTRAAMAILDIVAWAGLFRLLGRMGFRSATRILVLLIAAFLPLLQLWGVTTLQDHMGMILMVAALSGADHASRKTAGFRHRLGAGFLLGSLGWIKIQLGLFAAGWVGTLAVRDARQTRSLSITTRRTLPWILGGWMALALMGWVDLLVLGGFGESTLNQALQGESISRFYGTSPWTNGIGKLIELMGPIPWLLIALAVLIRAFSAKKAKPSETRHESIAPLLTGTLLYTTVHLLIPHKETRFFLPLAPAILTILASAWDPILAKLEDRLIPQFQNLAQHRQLILWMGLALALGTLGALGYGVARETPNYLSSTDITDLEDIISRIRPSLRDPEKICILVAGHNFSWTRGSLILGASVDYKDWPALSSDIPPRNCELALASSARAESFLRENSDFRWVRKGRTAFVLLARKDLLEKPGFQSEIQSD